MNYTLQFGAVFQRMDMIWEGVATTCVLALVSILAGFLIGVICACARAEGSRPAAALASVYVEFIRNTPFLAQLFLVAFGLPQFLQMMGIFVRPTPFFLATLALSLNLGAYLSEILRAGLESIHKSQIEAAAGLALTPRQIFLRVKLPQALDKVYPALTGQFILHMLGTSLVSSIAVQELTSMAGRIQAETFRTFETYFLIAAIYFGLAYLLRLILTAIALYLWPWRRAAFAGWRRLIRRRGADA